MMSERTALLRKIAEVCFCVTDIHLYQDTHPADTTLDDKLHDHLVQKKELIERYETNYGPLRYEAGSVREWLNAPWPWEFDREG